MMKKFPLLLAMSMFFVLPALTSAKAEMDKREAKAIMHENKCTKCHSETRTKTGPSLEKIAEKNKGKANAVDELIKQMTTGPMIKLEDGSQEEHKIIDIKDPAKLKDLAEWILSH